MIALESWEADMKSIDTFGGVIDGDGSLGSRNERDGDKITLTGSHDLLNQLKTLIEKRILVDSQD
jgi:hypothetical protein